MKDNKYLEELYTSKNNTIPKINEETHKIPSFFNLSAK